MAPETSPSQSEEKEAVRSEPSLSSGTAGGRIDSASSATINVAVEKGESRPTEDVAQASAAHGPIEEAQEDPSSPRTKRKKRKKKGRITHVGFKGKTYSSLQERWDEMFDRLVEFKRINGHCLVPNRYAKDPSLGAWVSTQRRQYKILTSGSSESTPMTPERASRLMSIGFVWATKDPRHVPWEVRFRELCDYKEKQGDCLVPIGYKDNVQLSNWVSTQRQEYKMMHEERPSRLTPERIQALEAIGFVWEAQRGGPKRSSNHRASLSADNAQATQGEFLLPTLEDAKDDLESRASRAEDSRAAVSSFGSPRPFPNVASSPLGMVASASGSRLPPMPAAVVPPLEMVDPMAAAAFYFAAGARAQEQSMMQSIRREQALREFAGRLPHAWPLMLPPNPFIPPSAAAAEALFTSAVRPDEGSMFWQRARPTDGGVRPTLVPSSGLGDPNRKRGRSTSLDDQSPGSPGPSRRDDDMDDDSEENVASAKRQRREGHDTSRGFARGSMPSAMARRGSHEGSAQTELEQRRRAFLSSMFGSGQRQRHIFERQPPPPPPHLYGRNLKPASSAGRRVNQHDEVSTSLVRSIAAQMARDDKNVEMGSQKPHLRREGGLKTPQGQAVIAPLRRDDDKTQEADEAPQSNLASASFASREFRPQFKSRELSPSSSSVEDEGPRKRFGTTPDDDQKVAAENSNNDEDDQHAAQEEDEGDIFADAEEVEV